MFIPRDYLSTYYTKVDPENAHIMDFYARLPLNTDQTVLEVGCGPSLMTTIAIIEKVNRVILTDALQDNLDEIEAVLCNAPQQFDWTPFLKHQEKKAYRSLTWETALSKIRERCSTCWIDMQKTSVSRRSQDVIISTFSISEASKDVYDIANIISKLTSYLKPDGLLAAIMDMEAHTYKSGDQDLPVTFTTPKDIFAACKEAGLYDCHYEIFPISTWRGYSYILGFYGLSSG